MTMRFLIFWIIMAFLPVPAYADDLKDLKQLVEKFGSTLFIEMRGLPMETRAIDFVKARVVDYPLTPGMFQYLNPLTVEYCESQNLLSLYLLLGLRTSGLLDSDAQEYEQASSHIQQLYSAINACPLQTHSDNYHEEVQTRLKQQFQGAQLEAESQKIKKLILMIPNVAAQAVNVQTLPIHVVVFRK
ncbi:hypothetical protein ACWJJH_04905 [Endozoicomonadaceae bacterium StTr2]